MNSYMLRRSDVEGISPDELQTAVFNAVSEDFITDQDLTLGRLTKGQKALVAFHIFMLEIFNGGIDQFFLNWGGSLAQETLDGMHLVGANKYADKLLKIFALFPNGQVPKDRDMYYSAVAEGILEEVRHKEFNEFDSTFYRMMESDPLTSFSANYVESNPADFFA
jgi:hypothetical protein